MKKNGYSPTIREISKHFGYSSPSGALVHVEALRRKGYIRRKKLPRSISLIADTGKFGVTVAEVKGIFYDDGTTKLFKSRKYVPLPTNKLKLTGFMSRVENKEVGISKGDYVFFEIDVTNDGLSLVKRGGREFVGLLKNGKLETFSGRKISGPFKVIGSFYGLLRIPEGRKVDE